MTRMRRKRRMVRRRRKSERMIFLFLVAGALCKDGPEFWRVSHLKSHNHHHHHHHHPQHPHHHHHHQVCITRGVHRSVQTRQRPSQHPSGPLLTIIYFCVVVVQMYFSSKKCGSKSQNCEFFRVPLNHHPLLCLGHQKYFSSNALSKMVLWTCTSKKTKGTQSCFRWKCWFIFLHCFSIFVSISHKSAETSIKIVKQIFYVFCGYQTNKVSWYESSFIFRWIVFDYLYQICCWCTFVHSNIF